MNAFNRKTGRSNRCFACNREYHYAPQCSRKENRSIRAPPYREMAKKTPSRTYSPFAAEPPLHVQPYRPTGSEVSDRPYERSFPANLKMGTHFVCARDDCVVVLDTGATANSVCFRRLRNRNSCLRKIGPPKVASCTTMAELKFGDGRVGAVRRAADIKVGAAARRGTFTAFISEAAISAELRKGPFRHLEANWIPNVIF